MMKDIDDLHALAQKRIEYAKDRGQIDEKFAREYLQSAIDELLEVIPEIKKKNAVHLEDELSDVLWNYFNLIATLESLSYVRSVDHVVSHGKEKFSQRFRAIEEGSSEVWDEIKAEQKANLALKHDNYLKINDESL